MWRVDSSLHLGQEEEDKETFLILENGMIFEGEAFGADLFVTGEIVFNTGMTGYQDHYGPVLQWPDFDLYLSFGWKLWCQSGRL